MLQKQKVYHVKLIKMKNGFTLIELITSIVILTIALGISYNAYYSVMRSWKYSSNLSESMHQGDFFINKISSNIRSIIFFKKEDKIYEFIHNNNELNGIPADLVSFVSTKQYLINNQKFKPNQACRLTLFIDSENNRNESLFGSLIPATINKDKFIENYNLENHLISESIQGLDILFWDEDNEEWNEEWNEENSIPKRIKLSIFIGIEQNKPPKIYSRIINIPVSENKENPLLSPTINPMNYNNENSQI